MCGVGSGSKTITNSFDSNERVVRIVPLHGNDRIPDRATQILDPVVGVADHVGYVAALGVSNLDRGLKTSGRCTREERERQRKTGRY